MTAWRYCYSPQQRCHFVGSVMPTPRAAATAARGLKRNTFAAAASAPTGWPSSATSKPSNTLVSASVHSARWQPACAAVAAVVVVVAPSARA